MNEIDWKKAKRISHWYAWNHLKKMSIVLGADDIVSETMLSLLRVSDNGWKSASFATIVCKNTKWSAIRLYRIHLKVAKIDKQKAFREESYFDDTESRMLVEDCMMVVLNAKRKIVKEMRDSIEDAPSRSERISEWRRRNEDSIRRIERYESGFIESRLMNDDTLDDLGGHFGVTKERARQIEGKFIRELKHSLVSHYGIPLDDIGDLLILGESKGF